jgi:hypothetical protein
MKDELEVALLVPFAERLLRIVLVPGGGVGAAVPLPETTLAALFGV